MTLFQVSYALLWALAIFLVPIVAVLIFLLAKLKVQVEREAATGIQGHWLIGRNIAELSCRDLSTGEARALGDVLVEPSVIMAFSPTCSSCSVMCDELVGKTWSLLGGRRFVVLCMGQLSMCQAMISASSARPDALSILVYEDVSDTDIFWVRWPAAIMVDKSGVVTDVRHPPSIASLVETLNDSEYTAPGLISSSNAAVAKMDFTSSRAAINHGLSHYK